jgi:hypothetical protein
MSTIGSRATALAVSGAFVAGLVFERGISALASRSATAAVERLSRAEIELLRNTYGPRELPQIATKGALSCY